MQKHLFDHSPQNPLLRLRRRIPRIMQHGSRPANEYSNTLPCLPVCRLRDDLGQIGPKMSADTEAVLSRGCDVWLGQFFVWLCRVPRSGLIMRCDVYGDGGLLGGVEGGKFCFNFLNVPFCHGWIACCEDHLEVSVGKCGMPECFFDYG